MSAILGFGFTKAVSIGVIGGALLIVLAVAVVWIIGFGDEIKRWGDE